MNRPDQARERDEIRRALSNPAHVCGALGILDGAKKNGDGLRVRCPLHVENDPSCGVTPGERGGLKIRCFAGCDFGGADRGGDELSLIAAVERLDLKTDFARVMERAREIACLAPIGIAAQPTAPPVNAAALWHAFPALDADGWEYLKSRGLDGAADLCRTVPQVGAGLLSGMRLAVAMRDKSGHVAAIQARNFESGKGHDFRVAGPSNASVFGDPARLSLPTMRYVFIVEGLTDYLAASVAVGASDKATVIGFAGVNNVGAVKALPVKGLRCIVATDADESGDRCADDLITSLNAAGAVCGRARPPTPHKDICDMRSAGVDVRRWFAEACKIDLGFRRSADRLIGERAARLADGARALPFGVSYLDAALGGIMPRDVILIGGESGGGKTELASIITQKCAARKMRVHYFALEPEPREIERRIKFKRLSLMVWGNRAPGAERFNFQDWHDGKPEANATSEPFEDEVDRWYDATYPNLQTFYRNDQKGDFTAADFDRMARALGDDSDLNVVDHVHYFDEGDDTNREQKRLGRRLRDLAIETGVPLIEIAHLRKKPSGAKKSQRLIPEKDDFEGSSHIFKPVKKAVILAPAKDQPSVVSYLWPTYFAVVKNTRDGSRCRYVGLVDFNARTNSYADGYVLGELVKDGTKFETVEAAKIPPWSRA